jgi:hypothetical protein
MEYIDPNPVKAGLAHDVGEWKASGVYYIRHGLSGLVDYTGAARLSYIVPAVGGDFAGPNKGFAQQRPGLQKCGVVLVWEWSAAQ